MYSALFAAALALAQTPQAAEALPADTPFPEEMARFIAEDSVAPPPYCPVLFTGSSSIRLWGTLAGDFAPLPVLNRGFGGSTIAQVLANFDHVAAPYHPRALVFYAGENDLASGTAPDQAAADFASFMQRLRARFGGDLPVFYISAKPSKQRFAQLEAQHALNAAIEAQAATDPNLHYVDIVDAMLDHGMPRDLYVEDGLHMKPEGYAIWREKLMAALHDTGADQRSCDEPSGD